MNNHLQM